MGKHRSSGMPDQNVYTRACWLNDPLDIIAALDAIKAEQSTVTLSRGTFTVVDAGYSALDRTLTLYRLTHERDGLPMGFFTRQNLELRLGSM